MKIHKEGFKTILITIVLLLLLNLAVDSWVAYPAVVKAVQILSLILFIIVLQFFRDPSIKSPVHPDHILSPCDGKVVVIEEVHEKEFFNEKRLQISIFMSPLNVHVNRNPISGQCIFQKYHPGKYLVAWHPKSSEENERTTFVVRAAPGREVLFRQIAGALARRIKWYVKEGQQVKQGEPMGFIKFGSRVDVFLPLNSQIKVEIGQKVKGGVTYLASFT